MVPRAATQQWVKIISKCYIGNGYGYREGVNTAADRYYQQYIEGFGEADIVTFLQLFNDPDSTVDFEMPKADKRAKAPTKRLKDETKNAHVLGALT